jgi:hypothetical protein
LERLAKLSLQKKLTKNSRMNSRKNSNASLLGDYARAPDDKSSDTQD